jgi:tRNA modification GTPase
MPATDTIAAIATPPGRGGIGIIRISGAGLLDFAFRLSGKSPRPRLAQLVDFRDAEGIAIDSGLQLFFPAPASFTGEDVLELHGHGGPVVLGLLLSRCLELGAHLALPGEFTRRAFLNGKLDLAQAESLIDLIDASTAEAARAARRSLSGEFSRAVEALGAELGELRLLAEASLDFPEEDIDFLQEAEAGRRLDAAAEKLAQVQGRAKQGKLLQAGLSVVLVGQPNVGKSSLMNRLAGEEVAIVTPVPGTTRDALKTGIQLRGIPLHLIDTAGLRHTDDAVEKIGIERAWGEIGRADLALALFDAGQGLTAEDREILARLPAGLPVVQVANKIDAAGLAPAREGNAVRLSAKTGEGVDLLEALLLEIAGWQTGEDVFLARARHLEALSEAGRWLQGARQELASPAPALELFAENLRLAAQALSAITGKSTPDDLLDAIFSRFCMGK